MSQAASLPQPGRPVGIEWVFLSPTIEVSRYHCRARLGGAGGEQHQDGHVLAFPHHGSFVLHAGREEVLAEPGRVVFFNAFEPYRTSHPYGCGDHGSALAVRNDALRDAVGRFDRRAAERGTPFSFHESVLSPAACLRERFLFRDATGNPDRLAVEEAGLRFVGDVVREAYAGRSRPDSRDARSSARRHRAIQAALAVLVARYREPLTLDALAREAGVSPFHLCRIFRIATGMPAHRYLNRLRLREAMNELLDSEEEITSIALGTGFSSPSHFAAAFRREFGLTPGRFRRDAARRASSAVETRRRAGI